MSHIQKNISVFVVMIVISFLALYLSFSATWMGAVGGLIMASGMSLFTLVLGIAVLGIQYYRNQKAYEQKQKADASRQPHQSQSIEFDLSQQQAFDLVMQALNTLDGADIPHTVTGIPSQQQLKIYEADIDKGHIKAGLRAKTIGIQDVIDFSKIEILIESTHDQMTRLKIDSYTTNPLEVYDFGRHIDYVNQIIVFVRQSVATDNLSQHSTDAEDSLYEADNPDDSIEDEQ